MNETLLMLADQELGRLVKAVLCRNYGIQPPELKGKERLILPMIKSIVFTPVETALIIGTGPAEEERR